MAMEVGANLFWADQLADEAIARAQSEKTIATCRSGASTSGAKHIGNMFDVMKSYIVHKAVLRKGFQSRFVLTHDDRDPLRTVPYRLPTLDAKWVVVEGELEKGIAKYLGYPYVNIPDPFGCCDSWARHFSKVWEDGISAIGVNDAEIHSNDILYSEGKFEPFITKALQNIEKSRRLIQKFQESKRSDYVPFDAVCENCGKIIGMATDFDTENKTIKYACSGKELAGKYSIEGCGHGGETDFNGGKLPWSFEWPAQWLMFATTFEPFGKEHAEGSWPRCSEICKSVYGGEPPIPHIYEFLLIDNEKMSARRGNAYITQEVLDIIEPEVFFYFYTKRSKKQRNLDIKNIHMLAEDFEHAERVYFGKDEEKNEKEKINLMRMYEASMPEIPKELPLRIPYQFAAIISEMAPFKSIDKAVELLRSSGHLKGRISGEDMERIELRLMHAKSWAEKFNPEARITINYKVSEKIKKELGEEEKEALRGLAGALKEGMTQEEITTILYDAAKSSELGKEFFSAVYRILISREQGPRLAPFIIAIGINEVKKILEQV